MLLIGVLNAKGGVGKSLLSTTLAVRAARDFARVGIVDLDPQRGSARWRQHRGGDADKDNPLIMAGALDAKDAVEKLELTGWDVAFFDGAPGSLDLTEDAIKVVDLVLIPLRAGDQDIASTEYVVSACQEFKTPYILVINEAMPSAGGDRRALEVHTLFKRHLKLPIAATIIHRRMSYSDAMNTGRSAAEIRGGKNDKAEEEIDALYSEVMTAAKAAQKQHGAAHAR